MKSICIKTNDSNLLNYLLNELKNSNLKNTCFSENKFKIYKNVIIHYSGTNDALFFSKIASILSFLVIDEVEESLLKRLLLQNYFYFDFNEREHILDICFEIMSDDFTDLFDKKFKLLYEAFYNFITNNKSIILNGFINFRLKEYLYFLEDIVCSAVNSFVIEKEYLEFISLLKLYINSQPYGCEVVHIIFSPTESVLLDKDKNLIIVTDNIFKPKIMSDISFSSNDYILNSLLSLMPEKIYIHLVDTFIDEFINTLQLAFENRVHLCTNCNICKLYKTNKISHTEPS